MAKAAVLRGVLAGAPLDGLTEAAEAFADHVVADRLRPEVRDRVDWHRNEGHELVLVSASPELYVTPIGRRLGSTPCLPPGSRSAWTVGSPAICWAELPGTRKGHEVREWRREGLAISYAYGDSAGDREMLDLAVTAVRVGRRSSAPEAPGH